MKVSVIHHIVFSMHWQHYLWCLFLFWLFLGGFANGESNRKDGAAVLEETAVMMVTALFWALVVVKMRSGKWRQTSIDDEWGYKDYSKDGGYENDGNDDDGHDDSDGNFPNLNDSAPWWSWYYIVRMEKTGSMKQVSTDRQLEIVWSKVSASLQDLT